MLGSSLSPKLNVTPLFQVELLFDTASPHFVRAGENKARREAGL